MEKQICSSSSNSSMNVANTLNSGPEKEMKYKGVRKRKWGKWVSEIRLPNSRDRIWLGSYDTAEKAARAFDAALFCLRGSNAKFNFSDDPPPADIFGGQSLSPGEIQAVAAQYANTYDAQKLSRKNYGINDQMVEIEEGSQLSSASEHGTDWSFFDMLEPPHDGGVATAVSDYSLVSGLDDLHEDGNVGSFLWSF